MWVCSLRNSVHNAFAMIHLFRDFFARNFNYRLVQCEWDILTVRIVHWATIIRPTRGTHQRCLLVGLTKKARGYRGAFWILRRNWVSRAIFSGFICFKRQAFRKSVYSLVFLLAVETHRKITRRNRVRSAWGAGKHEKIQHSNRVSKFYSQNISRIDFFIKTVAFPYKPLFKPSNRCNTTPPYAARQESHFAWSNSIVR